MFGLGDAAVSAAYVLCIVSALLCAVYGIVNWNRGNENESDQIREEINWQEEESQIEENL